MTPRKGLVVDRLNEAVASPHKKLSAHGLVGNAGTLLAKALKPVLRRATVFRIGNDVVEAACRLALDHPDVLAELSRRARLPYDVCFFEWSNFEKLRVCGGKMFPSTPEFVGALLTREGPDTPRFSWVTVSPSAEAEGSIGMSALSSTFDPDNDWGAHSSEAHSLVHQIVSDTQFSLIRQQVPASVDQPDYDHLTVDPWIFGAAPWHGKEFHEAPLQWSAVQSISRRLLMRFNPYERRTIQEALASTDTVRVKMSDWTGGGERTLTRQTGMWNDLFISYSEELGDPKLILALVSLLCAGTHVIELGENIRGEGSMFSGGRMVGYMDHRNITLKLPLQAVRRTLRAMAYRMKKRRHEVMGHWCSSHRVGDPSCSHTYEDTSPREKVCSLCRHKIWYKRDHMRGDASVGFVSHSYDMEMHQ